jgi:hypothetical protein
VGDKTVYKLLDVEVVILVTATLQFMGYGLLRVLPEEAFQVWTLFPRDVCGREFVCLDCFAIKANDPNRNITVSYQV